MIGKQRLVDIACFCVNLEEIERPLPLLRAIHARHPVLVYLRLIHGSRITQVEIDDMPVENANGTCSMNA